MPVCIRFPGPPPPISFTLPGGAKLTSMPEDSHDPCGPINSIFRLSFPAMGAIQPAMDLVAFNLAIVELFLCLAAILGALLALAGNPALSAIFPLPTIKNSADNVPIPGFDEGQDTGVPDATCFIGHIEDLICKSLKLIAAMPQLSMIVTLKDFLNAMIALMSCVQAKLNSLADEQSRIPADTGDAVIDAELACQREALDDFTRHAAQPLINILPMAQMVGKMAEPLQAGLPAPAAGILRMAVELGLIPMSDTAAKESFLSLIEKLKTGISIQIPDFTDISSLPAKSKEIQDMLKPVLAGIAPLQAMTEKLQSC